MRNGRKSVNKYGQFVSIRNFSLSRIGALYRRHAGHRKTQTNVKYVKSNGIEPNKYIVHKYNIKFYVNKLGR